MPQVKCIAHSLNPTDPAIIFFHGLNGHGSQTWMADKNDETTLWPKWLADDFKCAVYLVAYDAALSNWKAGAMPLPSQGDALVERLSVEGSLQNRPLILVGHSMGGLVIKTLIQSGLGKGVERHQNIVGQIRGVVFVGTPHNGSQLATLAKYFSVVLRTNAQVKNMQKHDAHLRSLSQQFLGYCSNQPKGKVSVLTFAETQGVPLGKRLFGLLAPPTVTVVDPDSSEPHVPGEIAVPLPENHFSICKLSDKEQPLYKSLLHFLRKNVEYSLSDDATETVSSELSKSEASQAQPSITTGNITAGDGGVALGENSGSITINNNRP